MNENNIKTNLAGLLEYTYKSDTGITDIARKRSHFQGVIAVKTEMSVYVMRYGLSPL